MNTGKDQLFSQGRRLKEITGFGETLRSIIKEESLPFIEGVTVR